MQKIYRHRVRVILGLSVIIVILLGGIFANQILSYYTATPTQNYSTFLPTIGKEKYYGSEKDDTFVNAFFVDKDTYLFYNNGSGIMQKSGNEENITEYEGEILCVAPTFHGFVTAIKTNENIALQHVDFDGIPFSSYTINLVDAEVQYLGYDGEICVAIRSRSNFDYVLSYYKFDDALKEVYRRDIYSLYNLSTIAIYPLSNQTIIFFSANYGSVKRGGYTILHNVALSTTTEYYSSVVDYTVTDAKPYENGYLVSVLEKGIPKLLYLDENFSETLIPIVDKTRDDIKIHTNSNAC